MAGVMVAKMDRERAGLMADGTVGYSALTLGFPSVGMKELMKVDL
jgi:hypothetical protein